MKLNKDINSLPIFGRDIVDDWSWDREEEEMREDKEDSFISTVKTNQSN